MIAVRLKHPLARPGVCYVAGMLARVEVCCHPPVALCVMARYRMPRALP